MEARSASTIPEQTIALRAIVGAAADSDDSPIGQNG
jgi:hypothetical protein